MKRLALFLDGTWNTVKSKTNVWLLSRQIADSDGTIKQECFYQAGVGTKWYDGLRGGALGYGLSKHVLEAYEWILANYEDGDQIFIFGFSRGAFTARSLAGLIARCGLLRKGAGIDPKELYLRYERPQATRPIYTLDYLKSIGGALTMDEEILLLSSRRVQIRAIAVWDTVGALGVPFGDIPGLSRKEFQFHNTRLSNIFDYAFHALAIDEHRQAFVPTLWSRFVPEPPDPPPPAAPREPVVEQRWFIGAHADVGGGNPTALPEIAMAWLAEKAEQAGLALKEPSVSSPAAFRAPITDSFADFAFGLYKLLKGGKKFIRTIQAARILKETHEETGKPQRAGWVETVNETIDASVFDRFRADPSYRPPALMNWAGLHGVDPASVHGAVECPTAGPVVTRTQSGRPVTGGH